MVQLRQGPSSATTRAWGQPPRDLTQDSASEDEPPSHGKGAGRDEEDSEEEEGVVLRPRASGFQSVRQTRPSFLVRDRHALLAFLYTFGESGLKTHYSLPLHFRGHPDVSFRPSCTTPSPPPPLAAPFPHTCPLVLTPSFPPSGRGPLPLFPPLQGPHPTSR